jgi:hypothetical protein
VTLLDRYAENRHAGQAEHVRLVGIDAAPVEVEVDVSAGLPKTVLVGLPELAVKESVHRIGG